MSSCPTRKREGMAKIVMPRYCCQDCVTGGPGGDPPRAYEIAITWDGQRVAKFECPYCESRYVTEVTAMHFKLGDILGGSMVVREEE